MSPTLLSYRWHCSSLCVSDMQSCALTSTSRWNWMWLSWIYPSKSPRPLIFSSSCSSSLPICSETHMMTAERPVGFVSRKAPDWESFLFSAYRVPLNVRISIDWMDHDLLHPMLSRLCKLVAQIICNVGICEVDTFKTCYNVKPTWLNLFWSFQLF